MSDTRNAPMPPRDYQNMPPVKKGRSWVKMALAFGVILLLGTCTYGCVNLFGSLFESQKMNSDYVRTALSDGLPDAGDPIYFDAGDFPQEGIDTLNRLLSRLGPPISIADSACNLNTKTGTSGSGTFLDCQTSVEWSVSPGTVSVNWRKKGGDFKLRGFNVNVSDIDAYTKLVQDGATAQDAAPEN